MSKNSGSNRKKIQGKKNQEGEEGRKTFNESAEENVAQEHPRRQGQF